MALGVYIWPRRQTTPGAKFLVLFMLGIIFTSVVYRLELQSLTVEAKLWWVRLRYLGNTGTGAPTIRLLGCGTPTCERAGFGFAWVAFRPGSP